MTFFKPLALASLAVLAFAACDTGGKPVTMADAFDLDIFGPHEDDLHSPYVAGSQFSITVSSDENESQGGWTVTSSDPSVIQVSSPLSGGNATVTCVKPGQAVLSVVDASGTVQDSHPVSVAIPDRVGLYAEGPLLTGAPDDSAEVTAASVVDGGQAVFLVRYFAQGTELYGNGALQPQGIGGVAASTISTSFASARDFLQVNPAPMGSSGDVSLVVGGSVVGDLPVTAVDPSRVTQVTMLAQSTDQAEKGDTLVLYAHAIDATSEEVYGASFNWEINDQPQAESIFDDGPADLFFYSYDSSVTEDVGASFESFAPYAIVHGQGGSVGSTSNVGCSMSGAPGASGAGPASMLVFGLVALGGMALRRRRVAA